MKSDNYFKRIVSKTPQFKPLTLVLLLISPVFYLLPLPTNATTENTQSIEKIREKAHALLSSLTENESARVAIDIGQVDPRLSFPVCGSPVDLRISPETDHPVNSHLIEARCADPSWRFFLNYRIKLFNPVVVARNALSNGTTIQAEDIQVKELDTAQFMQSHFEDPKPLIGFTIKRPLRAGEIITPGVIEPPKLVQRNQKIVAVATIPGLQVTAEAIALSDGKLGDWIRAQNTHSKRIVEGKVIQEGQIAVTP